MNISIFGTGYVGLVTGVCLAHIGHHVTCIDIDLEKISKLQQGIPSIYEPGLQELMTKNIQNGRLQFTTDCESGLKQAEVIYIAVGTPQMSNGAANLEYVEAVAMSISRYVQNDAVIVMKSTVPVGTNDYVKELIESNMFKKVEINMVSNPEFLREGNAIQDSLYGDRIVIGVDNQKTEKIMDKVNMDFNIPIFRTSIRSAEMIKYASNAFLATKISFINEIANICEKTGADIEQVAMGMGLDKRIGTQFLNAGIGYGGSCFPKDTRALVQIAGEIEYDFDLLKSVIRVNNQQQKYLIEKAKEIVGNLTGKRVGILGLSFKPNTDDMREAASLIVIKELIDFGASVKAYDPIAIPNAKKILNEVEYVSSIQEVLHEAELVFILTEWDEIKNYPLEKYVELMTEPVVFDGRNCFDLEHVKSTNIDYYSIGRSAVLQRKVPIA